MAQIYECDECGKQAPDLGEFIEIGSSNNSLSVKNNAKGNNTRQLGSYRNLHFCSQVCLNDHFFEPLSLLLALKNEMKKYKDTSLFEGVIKLIENTQNGEMK